MTFPLITRREALAHGGLGILAMTVGSLGSRRVAAADPEATADLIVRQEAPYNAEPPLPKLIEKWVTPVNRFFVRCHGNIPTLQASDLTLSIDGLVEKPLTLTIAELIKQFASSTSTATLTCAGNRRNEFASIKKVGGVQWDAGAIGNAEWQGVRLADVLKAAGVKPEAKHVWFEGKDQVTEKNETFPFGGSIPIGKATDTAPNRATLLATHMNGELLVPSHGFPLRTVVPGFIGARSVKWLHKITVSDRPSPNHFVADVYKVVPEENVELIAKTTPIYEFALNSAICDPTPEAVVSGKQITVKGFALTNGSTGRNIEKVELSADGGQSWTAAKLISPRRDYCWVLWSADVTVGEKTDTLLVRATDSSGEMQPRLPPWNYKGYQYNGWHSVKLKRA